MVHFRSSGPGAVGAIDSSVIGTMGSQEIFPTPDADRAWVGKRPDFLHSS
jgi:hypothetical protein